MDCNCKQQSESRGNEKSTNIRIYVVRNNPKRKKLKGKVVSLIIVPVN